ncbi:LysR family transcriptional regulator [Pseudonocardia endophytica]|uniref:DNA-binding transcriptional LysR family regulator n=1 Tax=Pseudonocardia endophytica TaxID=401976 RepID=A0A4R1I0H1_PSEEN|nr:LysR family transcriptional regulator [Pseudonocardia endophytica]TCK27005.1 DNA-binding transcriptional LysR family regulator [Pseudonocardia endophytica]
MAELTVAGLRVVHEVARQGSFSGAATVLGYTQSAVSRQVAATEAAVGTELFERLPRGVRPTAAGEVVVRRAGRVLGEIDGTLEEVAGVRDRFAGRLVVSAFPTAAAVLLPRAIARVRARHPDLRVDLQEAATPLQLRRLRAGRVEVAVVAVGEGLPDQDLDGLRAEPLRIPRGSGVAVGRDHRLADSDVVDVAELAGETWIVGTGAAGEPQFGPWPGLADPHVGHEVRHWATRFGLVAAGLGITLVPGLAADSVPRDVRWLPVRDPAGPPDRSLLAVTAAHPSNAAAALVRAIREDAARMA